MRISRYNTSAKCGLNFLNRNIKLQINIPSKFQEKFFEKIMPSFG